MLFALFDFAGATTTIMSNAATIFPDFGDILTLVIGVILAVAALVLLVRLLIHH